jgi:hypothetical protein
MQEVGTSTDVAECLREVPEQLATRWIDLLGEQTHVADEGGCAFVGRSAIAQLTPVCRDPAPLE